MFFDRVGRTPQVSHSIYIVAGEVSGDIHGAHLVQAMLEQTPEFWFFWTCEVRACCCLKIILVQGKPFSPSVWPE